MPSAFIPTERRGGAKREKAGGLERVRRPATVKLNKGARGKVPVKTVTFMKKIFFLLLAGAMFLCACQKEGPSVPPAPSRLPAEICQAFAENHQGVFQLNEGQMGTNSATLDFLRFANGHYSRDVFRPDGGASLGDVGNDVAIIGDEVWMVINNSGIVQVISKTDCSEIAAIQVPMPRNIAFDDTYAYVTSWNGAYVTSTYIQDTEGNWVPQITDYKNPKGVVYRINLETKQLDAQTVEVGYQPEGIAYDGGKLYVANSGGLQLPPDSNYGKTVSVIETDTFDSVETEVEVGVNPKNVIAGGSNRIFVTSLGDYGANHSSLYYISTLTNRASKQADYVTAVSVCGNTVYGIGAENEFDWEGPKNYFAWKWTMTGRQQRLSSPAISGTALSGLCVLQSGDDLLWLVTDQGDYRNPGWMDFYWKGEKSWSVTTGICPGHFAVL